MLNRSQRYGLIALFWVFGAVYGLVLVPLIIRVTPLSWLETLHISTVSDFMILWIVGCKGILLISDLYMGTWAERKKKNVGFFILTFFSLILELCGSLLILACLASFDWQPIVFGLIMFTIDAVFVRTFMARIIRNRHYVPPDKR